MAWLSARLIKVIRGGGAKKKITLEIELRSSCRRGGRIAIHSIYTWMRISHLGSAYHVSQSGRDKKYVIQRRHANSKIRRGAIDMLD
jgi:hypothetical protein